MNLRFAIASQIGTIAFVAPAIQYQPTEWNPTDANRRFHLEEGVANIAAGHQEFPW
jgi:hypothetical protein